ncbi:hypothetical protein, partial [Photobacterium sanguinicancri]
IIALYYYEWIEMPSRIEAKVTIAKLLEVAYSKNKGITTELMRSKDNFKVTVDQHGKVLMSGSVGVLTFSADDALKELGVNVKFISVSFSKVDEKNIKYKATFTFMKVASLSISGNFDIEDMILSCSGILCRAARALKNRPAVIEHELQRAIGGIM